MECKVVLASSNDIDQLNTISLLSKQYWGYPEEWINMWMNELTLKEQDFTSMNIFKMENSDTIMGFCAIEESLDNYEIMHLWLKPQFIGKGYGRRLLNECIQNVATKDKKIIVESDPNAEAFYSSQGFTTYAKRESLPKGRYLPLMQKA